MASALSNGIERLERDWQSASRGGPIAPVMGFEANGLVLGRGTILAGWDRADGESGRLEADPARILTLLSVAYQAPVARSVLGDIARAERSWRQGDPCLAAIHLALTGLPKLPAAEQAARRLFIADHFLAQGAEPKSLLRALDLDPAEIDRLAKYDPGQPREAAGNGIFSGRWIRTASELLSASAETLGSAAAFILRSGRLAGFGALLVPTPAGGRNYGGEIDGLPGFSYAWTSDEGELRIYHDDQLALTAHIAPGGVFRASDNRIVGRFTDNHIVIDTDALSDRAKAALGTDDEPKLCPKPGPDKEGRNVDGEETPQSAKDKDYEDHVKHLINPGHETPRGMGYQLPNPATGRLVYYDDCQHRTGIMVEAKGTGYAKILRRNDSDYVKKKIVEKWLDQANRQILASEGRPIEWHFAEKEAVDFAWKLFNDGAIDDRLSRIKIVYTPWSEK